MLVGRFSCGSRAAAGQKLGAATLEAPGICVAFGDDIARLRCRSAAEQRRIVGAREDIRGQRDRRSRADVDETAAGIG